MSLVEVIVAMVILAGALLSLAAFSGHFAHTVGEDTVKATAIELASDRLEAIKSHTNYTSLETTFMYTESTIPGFPGFTRQTLMQRVGGGPTDLVDYKIVTVVVTSDALVRPVRKTTVIPDF
jgi:Tfp pilus assembly protein PilV